MSVTINTETCNVHVPAGDVACNCPQGFITPKGLVGDGNEDGTGTDNTAKIQEAIEAKAGPVYIPPTEDPAKYYVVDGLQISSGVRLLGAAGAGPFNVGTRLVQKAGSGQSVITCHPNIPANEWVHWARIEDLYIRGVPGNPGGCGIDITRRTGENFLISGVTAVSFPESGIRLTRGSTPGGIFNCGAFRNGEYGFDLQRTGADVWHQFYVRSVSGDNNGTALIRVKTYGSYEDMINIEGVKSETSEDGKQQDVIVLDRLNNCAIRIVGVTAQAISPMQSVIRITGTTAVVIAENIRAHFKCAHWIYDESTDAPKTISPRGAGFQAECLYRGLWRSDIVDPGRHCDTTESLYLS